MLNKILNWFVVSSANPTQVSDSLKGVLLLNASLVINAAQAFNIPLTQNIYVSDVGIACAVFGGFLGIVGLARKIYLTMTNRTSDLSTVAGLGK